MTNHSSQVCNPTRLVAALAWLLCAWSQPALAEVPSPLWTEGSDQTGLSPNAPVSMRAFADLAEAASPAVINIAVLREGAPMRHPLAPFFGFEKMPRDQAQGTGFIIHEDGYALTNHHVVEQARKIEVTLADDRSYEARVIGAYPKLDIALLKFEAEEKLTVVPLGDSRDLRIGEWVVAIGNPFGLSHTVTAGIVSAKGRREVQPSNQPMFANYIQTDASINPGNSGGPLLNISGEVIGINTAINAAGQGIGFAVPVHMVKTILPQLARGQVSRSYLGVRLAPVSRALARKMGMKRPMGALISEVEPDKPADKAGLLPGDVITAWGNESVKHWGDLSWMASTTGTEKPVTITVRRGRQEIVVTARLQPFPGQVQAQWRPDTRPDQRGDDRELVIDPLGIVVGNLSRSQRRDARLKPGAGLHVRHVDRGSLSSMAGIERGDVLVQINGRPVVGPPRAFGKTVKSIPRGDVLSLLLLRGDRRIYLTFTL